MKKFILDFLITKIVEIRTSHQDNEQDYVLFSYIDDQAYGVEEFQASSALPMSRDAWNDFLESKLLPAIEESRAPENTGELLFEVTFSRKIWRSLFSFICHSMLEPDGNVYFFEISESSNIAVSIIKEAQKRIDHKNEQGTDNQRIRRAKVNTCNQIVVIRLDKNGNIV